MNRKTVPTAILLFNVANCVWLCGLQTGAAGSEKVYYGEVVEKSKDTITINVTPCGEKKKPQTISPYEILSSQETSCTTDGRKYIKVAVREQTNPDQNADKNKKHSPTEPDKKKRRQGEPPSDSPNPPGSTF